MLQTTSAKPISSRYGDFNTERNPAKEHHEEGFLARTIEQQTAKLPSDIWLWGALGAMYCSTMFHCRGEDHKSLFVGQFVPAFLLFGIYNKIVKTYGSD